MGNEKAANVNMLFCAGALLLSVAEWGVRQGGGIGPFVTLPDTAGSCM